MLEGTSTPLETPQQTVKTKRLTCAQEAAILAKRQKWKEEKRLRHSKWSIQKKTAKKSKCLEKATL